MFRRRTTLAAGFALLAALGTVASLAFAPTAGAYTTADLPGLGYQTYVDHNSQTGCNTWTVSRAPTNPQLGTNLGSDCDPDFQARLDAYIQATCPCAQTTTTAAATTTDPAATAPATTDPAAVTQAATTAATVTPPPACDVQCQIADLQAQVDALKGQLGRLVQILEGWPNLDPGILAELMALQQ